MSPPLRLFKQQLYPKTILPITMHDHIANFVNQLITNEVAGMPLNKRHIV